MAERTDRTPSITSDPWLPYEALKTLGHRPHEVGVIIVDHGSRRPESNHMLEDVVALFRRTTSLPIIEAAHMELAEPSIATAFRRAVEQGARLIVGHPYFLAPGRHWRQDIPELFRLAGQEHPDVQYVVTAPLGLHPLMQRIMQDRIAQCLERVSGGGAACDVCQHGPAGCQLLPGKAN